MSKKLTVTKFTILPSRIVNFEKRMADVKSAAGKVVPPIEFNMKKFPGIEKPLPKHLIPRAELNALPDSRKVNGIWVREYIPIEITHGDLTKEQFEYIGYIRYAQKTKTSGTGKAFLPELVKPIGMSEEDFVDYQRKWMPELRDMADKFIDKNSVNCFHCNPDGDNKPRDIVRLFRVLEDHQRYGKLDKRGLQDLKKDEIIQIGSTCAMGYTGIDVGKLGAFYQFERAVPQKGSYGSPQNPAGWGFDTMSIGDFCERMIRFYGQREKDWLRAEGRDSGGYNAPPLPLYKVDSPDILYSKGKMTALIDGNTQSEKRMVEGRTKYVRLGCFVDSKHKFLLKARCFDIRAGLKDDIAMWMMQHETGQGSVEEIEQLYKDGMKEALHTIEVPQVNPDTGMEVLDPSTGLVKMTTVDVPSPEFMAQQLGWNKYKGAFTGKWRAKCVPIMPPSTDSKTVHKLTNRMISFAKSIQPKNDLEFRIKEIVNFGYVGEKTRKDMVNLWPIFMKTQFERRKKQHYKNAVKEWKKASETKLELVNPGATWHEFDPKEFKTLAIYAGTIYSGAVSPYGFRGQSYQRGDLAMAMSHEFNIIYLTSQQWDEYAVWKAEREKKELAEQKEREERHAYDRIVNNIRRENRHSYPRPHNRQIPYTPPIGEFLDLMEWSDLNVPDRFNQANTLFQVNEFGEVTMATITDTQLERVVRKYRPVIPGQPVAAPPPAPTPSPVTIPASSQPFSEKTKKTQAEAKRMEWPLKQSSQFVGNKGEIIPRVEGWMIKVTNSFGLKFDVDGNFVPYKDRTEGRSWTLASPDGNAYVIYHPLAASYQPKIGQYYNLENVKLVAHDTFNGLKQNVIQDPANRMDLELINATKL